MLKLHFLFVCFITVIAANAQTLKICPSGEKLKADYLQMNVENLWIAGHHINWETGEPDMPQSTHGVKTHCSAFVASACKKEGIYILRPPQHGQVLLANAQYDWLISDEAKTSGWRKLTDDDTTYINAQRLANQGQVVVATYKNTDTSKPGHIALVMPSSRTIDTLNEDGPQLIMAGTHNFNYIALRNGFKSHITTWPANQIAFFVHNVSL